MILSRTFETDVSADAARAQIAAYLEAAGYKRGNEGGPLTYWRGSRLAATFSLSPKTYPATATIEVAPGTEAPTRVAAKIDVYTTGQMVTGGMRRFWEQEIDGLMATVAGQEVEQDAGSEETLRADLTHLLGLETRLKNGAGWFFWIAGLSLANSIIHFFGQDLSFLAGLGITQLTDGIFAAIARDVTPQGSLIVSIVALALDLAIAGVVALFGFYARRRKSWVFVVGMVLYALDSLLFLWAGAMLSLAFHGWALFGLYGGLSASRELNRLKGQARPASSPRALPAV